MTVVAVTGAAGYLGRRLLEMLDGRDDIRRVVGLDVVEPEASTRNLEFYRLDVRSEALAEVLSGCDVVYHLAATRSAGNDPEEVRDVNVGGLRRVLSAAVQAGVGRVVWVSSVFAYGAHPDNDHPLTEDSPVRPVRDMALSAHKGECEAMMADFREAHPDVRCVILRPAMILGPSLREATSLVVDAPVTPVVAGYDVPFQAVHETDVARALVHVLDRDLEGVYNVAPNGWITLERAAAITGSRLSRVSLERAQRRLDRLRRVGLSRLQPSFLPFLMYPWVMDNRKLRSTGFTFHYETEGTLLAAVEARRGWVSIGPMSFRPRRWAAAAAGAALVAGSLTRRSRRRAGA